MTKLSIIKSSILHYINSVMWLQERAIQEPLRSDVVVNTVRYPPNIIAEKPSKIDISFDSSKTGENQGVAQLLCNAEICFTVCWVFTREIYKTYHSVPRNQIEDLVSLCLQFVLTSPQGIDEDIISISAKPSQIVVKATEDVNSDPSNSSSWSVIADMSFQVEFISSPDEYSPVDFNKIQPATWDLLDDLDPITPEEPFTLNGLIINLYKSELPSVNTTNEETYQLEETLYIPSEIEDQI
ncbi:hypothetical protein [Nostoc phage N1]|nr:hypothetical protein [Nostoc phage N1]